MKLFAIRHKETGNFMPQFKRGGHTVWDPRNTEFTKSMESNAIRLFPTWKSARNSINQWELGKLEEVYTPSFDMFDGNVTIVRTAREKGQLEIVEVELTIIGV